MLLELSMSFTAFQQLGAHRQELTQKRSRGAQNRRVRGSNWMGHARHRFHGFCGEIKNQSTKGFSMSAML